MDKIQVIRRTVLILGIMLVVCVFVRCVIRWSKVAALQNSLQRNWEINFNSGGRPRYLPAFADNLAEDTLLKMYETDRGNRNRDVVYHDRFQCLFRGPLRRLEIYYPEDLYESFGPAISRLRQLEALTIFENDDGRPSMEHWQSAFRAIAQLPALRELEIGGERITNETLSALAGAPKLEKLSITYGRLDPGILAALPPLPALRELHLEGIFRHEGTLFAPANRGKGSAALPQYEHLEKLVFLGSWTNEEEWNAFLGSLAQCPNLQELELSDDTLTNEALQALANAPKLRKLSICGQLDPDCAATLRMLPALRELSIASTLEKQAALVPGASGQPGLSDENLATIRAALPNVRVNEP